MLTKQNNGNHFLTLMFLSHNAVYLLPSMSLLYAPDNRSKVLAQSLAIQHAGDWLSVIPLGLHCLDQEFRVCLLGIYFSLKGHVLGVVLLWTLLVTTV